MTFVLEQTRPASIRRFPRLSDMLALARQRRDLSRLDDAQLRDMGLSRSDAASEANRPAWDVPSHWTR
ncbi:DUF1127 domain-containing protein [Primorskyibacter sp. S187A]|uniref:DUF1127 domain-containing protein n=1 Tax=Primorskyibacter sp. S187A TaxID=3415130 RepID=UPI003C7994D4